MIAAAAHPAVAIGGIDVQRLPEVVAHGAKNVAIVRAVCHSTTPYTALLHLQSLLPTPAND
jgi:thiamine monophosphate synthase